MKILAVDDNIFILDLLRATLGRNDFPNLTTATSAANALEILAEREGAFDCLLLDIDMPGMNGINLCKHIRMLDGYQNTPIIMLTLKSDLCSIEQAFAAGANDYILKPFSTKEVKRRLCVAERLMKASNSLSSINAFAMQNSEKPGIHDFKVEDPVQIQGTDQLILPFSMGNFLSQLSTKQIEASSVFAVQIDGIRYHHETCTTREFIELLLTAVRSIRTSVGPSKMLLAYNGGGTIICILTNDVLADWDILRTTVHQNMEASTLRYEDGRRMYVSLSIGGAVQPFANRTQRVKMTFDRATRRAATCQNAKRPNTIGPKAIVKLGDGAAHQWSGHYQLNGTDL